MAKKRSKRRSKRRAPEADTAGRDARPGGARGKDAASPPRTDTPGSAGQPDDGEAERSAAASRDAASEQVEVEAGRRRSGRRRPRLSDDDGGASGASRPGPRTSSAPAGKPWWMLAAIAAVIGVVAYQRIGNGEEPLEPPTREVVMQTRPSEDPPQRLRVQVIQRLPHERDAFTQGLLWYDGHLYESTGLRRHSSLRQVELETGRVLRRRTLEPRLFAEGLARVGERLYQLTWTAGEAHVWNLSDFSHVRTHTYEGEGWGLCYDGERLVMSDGSHQLTFRDPETFRVTGRVSVRLQGAPLDDINELECVDGVIWANVWQREQIVRIDPGDGRVTAVVDASRLLREDEVRWDTDVLNGIAWIPERGHFVITGKQWPALFEVDFVPDE